MYLLSLGTHSKKFLVSEEKRGPICLDRLGVETKQIGFTAHPNVKLFITHGGARSLEEAVFYKVPIIGLPLVKSRKVFINEITRHGAGEILDPYNLDKETVKATITKVASTEK